MRFNNPTRFGFVFALMVLLTVEHCGAQSFGLPQLTANGITNGKVQLTLVGETNVSRYVIQSSSDLKNWSNAATNTSSTNTRVILLNNPSNAQFYRAQRDWIPVFGFALAARQSVILNGNTLATDSYDSGKTNLSTLGRYDVIKASTNGHIASIGGVINIGNRYVKGSAYLGLAATLQTSPNGFVMGNVFVTNNLAFPDVTLPITSWVLAPLVTGVHTFTSSGHYTVNDLYPIVVNAGVTAIINITTPVTYAPSSIQIHGGRTNSGTAIFYLNGPPALTVVANTATDSSGKPENLRFLGLPSLTSVSYSNVNSYFDGLIYAPSATISLGGTTRMDFSGSFIGNNISMNGNSVVHYDESLQILGPFR